MIIGLTGGIASGKSLVADEFRALGVPVIDTDEIARQVVTPGQPAWLRLREAFSPAFFCADGTLDRAAMARHVFADAGARRILESITHPAIFTEVDRQIAILQKAAGATSLIVVVVPLLFEVGAESRFDRIILVYATPELQSERLMRMRGYSRAEADARLAAQLPLQDKIARATDCIDNTGSIEETREQVRRLIASLRNDVRG